MTLTLSRGPLSGKPADTNYRIDGPAHRLFFEDFPRRVRAVLAAEPILDTRRGKLLHETGLLPQLYVPREDVRLDLCTATDHRTHCPFKGDASYWSVRAGDRIAENTVWAYPEPCEAARWLRGYVAFYWDAMDGWFDEDEEVQGHLRDPYHRVDVRDSRRHVRVVAMAKYLPRPGDRSFCPRPDCRTGFISRPRMCAASCSNPAIRAPSARTRASPPTARSISVDRASRTRPGSTSSRWRTR